MLLIRRLQVSISDPKSMAITGVLRLTRGVWEHDRIALQGGCPDLPPCRAPCGCAVIAHESLLGVLPAVPSHNPSAIGTQQVEPSTSRVCPSPLVGRALDSTNLFNFLLVF